MKLISMLLAAALMTALPAAASAQDGAKKKHGKKRDALLKKFDKDGDGKLNEQERAAAKEFKAQRRGEEGGGDKKGLRKKIFKRFDSNHDRKLDDAERAALKKYLEHHLKKGGKRGRR